MNKTNKVAVVTGASQGIGLGIFEELEKAGFTTIKTDILPNTTGEKNYFKCDISSVSDRAALAEFIEKNYGRLDLLVNNAGVAPRVRMDILETTEESFDFVNSINLKAAFFMCQTFANLMIKFAKTVKDYTPAIVNIGSISAYTSSTMRGEYCTSKAGMSMVTSLFADRLASENIAVFEVRPGVIVTPMTAAVTEKYQKMIDDGLTPVKALGTPKDVAQAVLAAANLPIFSTGTIINADGGFAVRRL